MLDFGRFVLPGAVFGALISVCLALRGHVRRAWKAVAITAASSVAYYVSVMTGFAVSSGGSINALVLFACIPSGYGKPEWVLY